jgi:hypothetical protein
VELHLGVREQKKGWLPMQWDTILALKYFFCHVSDSGHLKGVPQNADGGAT